VIRVCIETYWSEHLRQFSSVTLQVDSQYGIYVRPFQLCDESCEARSHQLGKSEELAQQWIATNLLDTFQSHRLATSDVLYEQKRYPAEFKIEAVKQVAEASYSPYAFARRLHHQSSNTKSWPCYVSNLTNNSPCAGVRGSIGGMPKSLLDAEL